ncbi:MAG: NADH-quinone oxidoreductase subunit J [Pseudomonadaceae bacterium]|nr:NADH-quinone oxidoreductase subunit J [Pseudomonadaceae bacterium]
MLADILFLAFATAIILGAGTVVLARNPMVGVLGLVFTFLNAAGLFILLQAEFLGLLLIMVYVGAIAVMFLFVLMTIDIDFVKLREGMAAYLPLGAVVMLALLAELLLAAYAAPISGVGNPIGEGADTSAAALGALLFTDYNLPFQMAGLVLLTAMVGAIVLTHRRRSDVKRQNIAKQVLRKPEDSMTLTQPKVGGGVTASHWEPQTVEEK